MKINRLLSVVLLGTCILLPGPCWGQFQPGSPTNPYVIHKGFNNQVEVTTQFPDFNKGIFAPGNPANPWVIEKDAVTGDTKIHTELPSFMWPNQGSQPNGDRKDEGSLDLH